MAGFGRAVSDGQGQAKPDLPDEAVIQQGLADLMKGDYGLAIDAFQRAAKNRQDGGTYFLLGYAHYARGFAKGTPEAADKRDAREAVKAYEKALQLDPWLTRLEHPYKLYHSLGLCYEALGHDRKALAAYQKAVALQPDNPVLALYVSRLWLETHQVGKATAQFRLSMEDAREDGQDLAMAKLVATSPLFSPMLKNPSIAAVFAPYRKPLPAAEPSSDLVAAAGTSDAFGLRDSVRGTTPGESRRPKMSKAEKRVYDRLGAANDEFNYGRYRYAVTAYNDVLTLNEGAKALSRTQIAFLYERVGTAYNKLGLSGEAIDYLRRSLAVQPMSPAANYQLALAYAVTGRYQDCLRSLSAAFQAAPAGSELKRYVVMSKTDSELEAVRDLTGFQDLMARYEERAELPRRR